jgi:hypothetical protein
MRNKEENERKSEIKKAFHEQKLEKIKQGKIEKYNYSYLINYFVKFFFAISSAAILLIAFLIFILVLYPDKIENAFKVIAAYL